MDAPAKSIKVDRSNDIGLLSAVMDGGNIMLPPNKRQAVAKVINLELPKGHLDGEVDRQRRKAEIFAGI